LVSAALNTDLAATDDEVFAQAVYGMAREGKQAFLLDRLQKLVEHHADHCTPYLRLLDSIGASGRHFETLADLPYVHVRLFKDFRLLSVAQDEVVKELTSSGTSGQQVSRIFLDRTTAHRQTRALVAILQEFLGKARLPMLIADHPNVIRDRASFSARGAGILGLSNFGRDHTYLLDEDMAIDFAGLDAFLTRHDGQRCLMFGFTFMVWQYLVQALRKAVRTVDMSNFILIHSGGWKKLQDQAVDNATFRRILQETTSIRQVHNFYGMVEQVGSIFMECEAGHLHTPVFADVLIRHPLTLQPLPVGLSGIIQVLSILPWSYPGHSLLTEDVGMLLGEDDCPCGRMGKYFQVEGRIPRAEARGCSDTFSPVTA